MTDDGDFKTFGDILFFIIVIGAVVYAFVDSLYLQECNIGRPECSEYEYCGTDNKCHQFPVQEKMDIVNQEIIKEQGFVLFSYILGFVIIVSAFIFRRKNVK